MNKEKKFSLAARIKSFTHAFNGLSQLLLREHNSRIHLLAAVVAVSLGFYLKISNWEWCILSLTIASVIGAEMLNSAIESLADAITEDYHPKIKLAKDFAAGAVLVFAISSLLVGGIIFIPKLMELGT